MRRKSLEREYLDEINAMKQAHFEGDQNKKNQHEANALELMEKLARISEDEKEDEG